MRKPAVGTLQIGLWPQNLSGETVPIDDVMQALREAKEFGYSNIYFDACSPDSSEEPILKIELS